MQLANIPQQLLWTFRSVREYKNPWWYFQLGKEPVTVHFRRGGTLKVRDREDAIVVNEIFLGRIYDGAIRQGMEKHFYRWTFIDVGANIGCASLRARQLGAKRITAYEPEPKNFALLQENIGEWANCINAAVSDRPGKMKLYYGINHGTHSLYHKKGPYVTVKVVKLNSVVADVLKLDCEGAEEAIIKGTDLRFVDCVIAESYDERMIDYLRALNFNAKNLITKELLREKYHDGIIIAQRWGLV